MAVASLVVWLHAPDDRVPAVKVQDFHWNATSFSAEIRVTGLIARCSVGI
jgi:hypothetical protein